MSPEDFLKQLDEEQQAKKQEQDKTEQIGAVNQSGDKVVGALKDHTAELTGSIHDLLMATLVSKDPKIAETAKNLANLLGEIKNATADIKGANFKPLADNLSQLQETLTTVPKQIEAAHQATDPTPLLKEIAATLGKKNFNPNVSVKAPSVDLSPLTKILSDIKTAVLTEKEPDNSKLEDLTQSVASGIDEVKNAITSLRFPVPNYVLPFSSNGKDTQVTLDGSGNVPVSGSFIPSGTQDTNLIKVSGSSISLGQNTSANSLPITIASDQSAISVSQSGTWNIGTLTSITNALPAGTNVIGHVITDTGSTTAVTGTVTVSGTVAATQSGTWNVGLSAGSNAIGTVGTTSAAVNVGQQTVSTTAVQLSASSTIPTNGIIVRALAANSAAIYVGGSGVTTSNGYELSPGESISFTCNLNTLYIRSVASTTDKVCWNIE